MALARRRLAREIKRLLKEGTGAPPPPGEATTEMDRLVLLARLMLDSTPQLPELPEAATELKGQPPAEPPKRTRSATKFHERPPTPDHTLVMEGHGGWLPTPDLVGCLGSFRKSGVLRIRTAGEVFTIEFQFGDIVHCESTRLSSGQRIGDILVAQGSLDRNLLEKELEVQSTERLGIRLVNAGIVSQEQLDAALKAQIQVLFYHLCREEVKSFSFWVGPAMFASGGIRLSAIGLLLEGTRVNDEFASTLDTLLDPGSFGG